MVANISWNRRSPQSISHTRDKGRGMNLSISARQSANYPLEECAKRIPH